MSLSRYVLTTGLVTLLVSVCSGLPIDIGEAQDCDLAGGVWVTNWPTGPIYCGLEDSPEIEAVPVAGVDSWSASGEIDPVRLYLVVPLFLGLVAAGGIEWLRLRRSKSRNVG